MFTFNLTSEDAEIQFISNVRMQLGDTIEGKGINPDGTNVSDEEIAFFHKQYSDLDTVLGKMCQMMATRWATYADIATPALRENFSQVSQAYDRRAKAYRQNRSGFLSPKRIDGFQEQAE